MCLRSVTSFRESAATGKSPCSQRRDGSRIVDFGGLARPPKSWGPRNADKRQNRLGLQRCSQDVFIDSTAKRPFQHGDTEDTEKIVVVRVIAKIVFA